MHLRARYRREVVEEILDIRVFSHMDLLLRQKQGELNKSVVDVKHRYDLMTEKYELQKKHFEEIQSRDYRDIDETLDDFIQHFVNEYLVNIPKTVLADKRLLAKNIKRFYQNKGNEDSYKFLFRILL